MLPLFLPGLAVATPPGSLRPPLTIEGDSEKAYCGIQDYLNARDSLGTVLRDPAYDSDQRAWVAMALNEAIRRINGTRGIARAMDGMLTGRINKPQKDRLRQFLMRLAGEMEWIDCGEEPYKGETVRNKDGSLEPWCSQPPHQPRRTRDISWNLPRLEKDGWHPFELLACDTLRGKEPFCQSVSLKEIVAGGQFRAEEPSDRELSTKYKRVNAYVRRVRTPHCRQILGARTRFRILPPDEAVSAKLTPSPIQQAPYAAGNHSIPTASFPIEPAY